ncbi:MAG: hypothetical protein HZB41_01790 [Ignavibacteriae bacterium]|nr:hypothetical protein [Ignavibacteriota bacterium]
MKHVIKFEFHEVKIRKADADLIRERILSIAKENNIGTEPIQYEDLLRDIRKKLIELSSTYEFVLDGKPVDFTQENFAMFKSKVLKTFLYSKLNDDILSLLKKNLDILCFYAFSKPWSETEINNRTNEIRDVKSKVAVFLLFFKKKNVKRNIILMLFAFLLFVIILLTINYSNLQNYYKIRESRYQDQIKIDWVNHFKFYNIDLKNYDTLEIPKDEIKLFIKNFNVDTSMNFPGSIKIKVIKGSEKFMSEPGVKKCNKFNGEMAFGFGKSYCEDFCYDRIDKKPYLSHPYKTILRINFKDSTYISYLSFSWVEMDGNWGSGGWVFINGKQMGINPYNYIGIYPPSNLLKDEIVRNYKLKVNEVAKYVDIAILDIANESEIFINDIIVYGK